MNEEDENEVEDGSQNNPIKDMSNEQLDNLYKKMIESAPNKEIKDFLNKIKNK